jgi:hypothetical protein
MNWKLKLKMVTATIISLIYGLILLAAGVLISKVLWWYCKFIWDLI